MSTMSENENSQTMYGFYGRLRAEFPSQIVVDVTEVCNLACIHCPHPEFKKSEHYNRRYLDPDLNTKMVDEVRVHGADKTQYIRYTSMGEPLLHPKIYEMLDYAARQSGVMVTLTTNGVTMTEKNIEKLLESGLDVIDISIDAFQPETYAVVRVKGDLHVTRANVLKLLELREQAKKKTKVVVSFVEQPQNTTEVKDFEAFWKDKGADYVVIRRLHSAAGAVKSIANTMWQDITGDTETRRPCVYLWERILLGPTGMLSFCPTDWIHASGVIDYHTTTILETWQGEFYRKIREAHLTNNYTEHQFCGQCPDWKVVRWPTEGRSYANMIEDFKREGSNIEVSASSPLVQLKRSGD